MSEKRKREGKSQLIDAITKENQDIADFFKNNIQQPKKKKKQTLGLAIPIENATPAVEELQKSGAGFVSNSFTHTAKKVTRGKNAAKGRGTVQETSSSKRIQQLPLDKIPKKRNLLDDDDGENEITSPMLDDDEFLEDFEFPDIHGEGDEDNTHVTPLPFSNSAGCIFETDDGIPVGKPIYTNDAWAFTTVKKLQKELKQKQDETIPAFYLRRHESPECVELRPVQDNCKGLYCKILTFFPDGSFKWPQSSEYLCWNCCHSFEGPPAMIPRYFNVTNKFYEVYGNFCSWSCAKRYSMETYNEYKSEVSPSIDLFAKKYFGATLPIAIAPPKILLNSFSDFGISIEEYRQNSQPTCDSKFQIIHPPCVPYEIFAIWEAKNPPKKRLPSYSKVISQRFEEQMSGVVPLPAMPLGITQPQISMSIDAVAGSVTTIKSQKKRTKNLITLLAP